MKESISFDRAASFYDATRKLPRGPAEAVTRALVAEILAVGAERVLEVGIGTGRMSRPLMLKGVRVVGADISTGMMRQLLAQLTPEHKKPDLLLGDATALPFRDGSFRAAMLVHVLHLVSSIEETLAEVRRVLAPGGVFLHQVRVATPETQKFWDESHDEIGRLLNHRGFLRRSRFDQDMIRETIRQTGASLRVVDVAASTETSTVDEELERIRRRSQSWTWQVPGDLLDDVLPEYEKWLRIAAPDGWTDHVMLQVEVWRWD